MAAFVAAAFAALIAFFTAVLVRQGDFVRYRCGVGMWLLTELVGRLLVLARE
jgi:hypothetical protein